MLELGYAENFLPGGGAVPAVRVRFPHAVGYHGFWRFTGESLTIGYSLNGASAGQLEQLVLHQSSERLSTLFDGAGHAYSLRRERSTR